MVFAIQRLFTRAAASFLILAAGLPVQAQVSAGPGAWSSQQTWAADTVNGDHLTGYFYWPASQPTVAGKRALVLVLHGCKQTAAGDVINDGSDGGFNWKTAADQYGAVILAPNATGNVYSSHCWDYANTNHSRARGHDAILLDLVNRFVTNPQYAIDPNQVYVTGLSSGGGETMALGCMAPDIFAGVGINAGPPPGTTIFANRRRAVRLHRGHRGQQLQGAGRQPTCRNSPPRSPAWCGAAPTSGSARGPARSMRRQCALAYGGAYTRGAARTVAPGGSNIPYTDSNGNFGAREMSVASMDHAWPAGSGGRNGNFVDGTRVNYPAFVMNFWFQNNLRVSAAASPVVTSCSASVAADKVTVAGAGTDPAGSISSYKVVLSGATPVSDAAAGSGASFSKVYASMSNGFYTGSVTATDSGTGLTSAPCGIAQFLVGPPPAILPPTGLAVGATTAIFDRADMERRQRRHRLQRLPRRRQNHRHAGHHDRVHQHRPGSQHQLQLPGVVGRIRVGGKRAVAGGLGQHHAGVHLHRDLDAATTRTSSRGRAHDSFGFALANGSNQNMGLDNPFFGATLAQTSPGYFVIGKCPSKHTGAAPRKKAPAGDR